jgi:hypothetical protein
VRGYVRDDRGLAGSVRGMPCCPTQVSGRGHCMAGCRASLGHLDLATHPAASMLDRLTRSWVFRLSRLEQAKHVCRARCRPESEELVVRIGEGPTAADRHEARVSDLRENHRWHLYHRHPPNAYVCLLEGIESGEIIETVHARRTDNASGRTALRRRRNQGLRPNAK